MNTQRFFFLAFLFLIFAGGFWVANLSPEPSKDPSLEPVSLALDWTPNTNHTGIYVALHYKWYEEEGIALRVLPFGSVSPDTLVYAGQADLGISSTEAIVADQAAGAPVVSVAAIIAHNTSSLAARKDSGITRPKDLDGKIYGGYGAPFEEPVIGTMIKSDGGKGTFTNVTLSVDPLEAIASKRIDFAWIFDAWQGIAGKRQGLELMLFPVAEYGIPDYSTPDIITSRETLNARKGLLKKFMRATVRGYEYARTHPPEAAQILINEVLSGTFPDEGLVFDSQEYLSPRYADEGKPWGRQSEKMWRDYPIFMLAQKAVFDASGKLVNEIDFNGLYTNELFD